MKRYFTAEEKKSIERTTNSLKLDRLCMQAQELDAKGVNLRSRSVKSRYGYETKAFSKEARNQQCLDFAAQCERRLKYRY
jgi:hypothetical protein